MCCKHFRFYSVCAGRGRLKGGRLKVCVLLLQEGTEDIATSVNTRVSADKVVIIIIMCNGNIAG